MAAQQSGKRTQDTFFATLKSFFATLSVKFNIFLLSLQVKYCIIFNWIL